MRKHPLRFIVASCAIGLVVPATADAQVDSPQQPGQVTEQPGQVTTPGAENQPQTGAESQPQDGEQYESRRVAQPGALQDAKTVQGFLANKLMLANRMEIELSQLATEKSEHQEVKEFAQKMVQEHQQMNQKLQQLQPGQAAPGQPDRPAASDNATRPQLGQAEQGQEVPQQLIQVSRQAAENHLQLTKRMLQRYEGQDFDMAFIGLQATLHTSMLAHLQAMQGVGSPEFQQLVGQAEQATKQHLQMAQQLAQKFEDDRAAINQEGETPNARPRRGAQQRNPDAQPAAQPARPGAENRD